MGEKNYIHYGLVATIIILAAVLRVYGLARTSIWFDEAFTWQLVSLPFSEMYQETLKDTHPPLFNLLAWSWIQLFGDSEFALRLPSALFGTATVYFLYQVGKQAWDWKVGLSAAAILAISGFHIWYSQEFRNYALLSLTSTIYMYSVFRIKDRTTLSACLPCAFL